MENRKFNFVNAVMIICPILVWACLFAVLFIDNTTVNVCIIAFQLAVLCFQIVVYLTHKRKKQNFYEK
jgi:hypothetical protein